MKLQPKHVVAIVVSLSAAAVLTPLSVAAATGSFVNIVDPIIGSRKARIGSNGALQVETRPGATPTAVNVSYVDIQNLSPRSLLEVTHPNRAALSDLTISVRDFGNPVVAATVVDLIFYVHVSGTNPCGGTGWSGTVLRRLTLNTDETIQVDFDGPPLMMPAPPSGKRGCLAAKLYQWVGDTRVDIGATVFSYQ
jgi:hypothetical protein